MHLQSTMWYRYNTVNFRTNPESDWYFASVLVIIYVIAYNIGPRYHSTVLTCFVLMHSCGFGAVEVLVLLHFRIDGFYSYISRLLYRQLDTITICQWSNLKNEWTGHTKSWVHIYPLQLSEIKKNCLKYPSQQNILITNWQFTQHKLKKWLQREIVFRTMHLPLCCSFIKYIVFVACIFHV